MTKYYKGTTMLCANCVKLAFVNTNKSCIKCHGTTFININVLCDFCSNTEKQCAVCLKKVISESARASKRGCRCGLK